MAARMRSRKAIPSRTVKQIAEAVAGRQTGRGGHARDRRITNKPHVRPGRRNHMGDRDPNLDLIGQPG